MLAVAYFLLGFFVGAVSGAVGCLVWIEVKTSEETARSEEEKP